MAAIVVVHGIGKQYLGAHLLHGGIAPALLDGVRVAGGPPLKVHDVEVAFYGHWFRSPGSAPAKGEPAYSHHDVTDPFEVGLLVALWQEAARLEPGRVESPDIGTARSKAAVPHTVQRALYALSRSSFLVGTAERFLIGALKQVRLYLTDDGVRDRVQKEIAACVAGDTRVLVGHSLGSVVAYEALCAHPEWPVTTLVTMGSPLGIPNLVFDRLRPSPQAGTGSWPGGVLDWTNLCDRGDIVALAKQLAPLFSDKGRAVTDVLVDNGWRAHAIERHLTAVETGKAVAAGLARNVP